MIIITITIIIIIIIMITIIIIIIIIIMIKNLFKVGYNNIVYSKNRATNSNQLFTKIHFS